MDVGESEEAAVAIIVLLGQLGDLLGWECLAREVWGGLGGVFLMPAVRD